MSLIAHPTSGLLLVGSPAQGGSGLLAVSINCCCNTSGGGPDCPECCCTEYTLTVTGVTGGIQCAADIDGAYLLPELIPCVTWRKALGGLSVSLLHSEDPVETCGIYRATIGPTLVDSASARYSLPGDEWDCEGCNLMELEDSDGACVWPATIEVCCND